MDLSKNNAVSKTATLGGICFSIIGNLQLQDVLKTAILGAVGTAVSFFISMLLSWLFNSRKK